MSELPDEWVWPPPGLERLSGLLPTVTRRGTAATLLAGLPLLWITISPDNPATGAAGVVLAALLAFGLAAYLSAVLRAAAVVDLSMRARRLGYSRATVLDVLADRGGDAAPLIRATGEHASLRPRILRTVRHLRAAAAVAAAVAGLIPLPLLGLGILLALRGAASPASLAALLLAPLLLLAAAALALRGYAAMLLEWERSAGAWDPAPVHARELAAAWQQRHEPASAARSRAGLPLLLGAGFAGVAAFVLLFVTVAAVGLLAGWSGRGTRTRIPADLAAFARAEAWRPLTVPRDSTLGAAASGRAYHELLSAAGDVRAGMLPHSPLPPLWDGGRAAPASFRTVWRMVLGDSLAAPVPGWTALEPHPTLAHLATLARTDSLDPFGARWNGAVPVTELGGYATREPALRLAVLRPVRDAAVALRSGNRERARAILRDLLSAGLVLLDHGRTPADLFLALQMIDAGGTLLGELEGSPDHAAGDVIVRTLRRTRSPSQPEERLTDVALRARITDDQLYPALRWDAARLLQQRQRCGSPAALLFPRTADRREDHLQLATLATAPGDAAALDALTGRTATPTAPALTRRARRILRAAEFIGGTNLARHPCVSALLRGE